jgi:two-component system, LuxR family, sensor kinase FixL
METGTPRGRITGDQAHIIEELLGANRQLAKALEENLRLEGEKLYLASIVESSHDPIIAVNLDGLVTAWNEAAHRVFGYAREEILGKPVRLLFPADRAQTESGLIARVAAGETLQGYQTQRLRKDGAALDVFLTLSPIRDADGRIIGASKIVEDLTERNLREHQLRRLEADRDYLADLVESSTDAIVAGTLDGRIASWNRAAEAMFGYSAGEVVGLSIAILSPSERANEMGEILARLTAKEQAVQYETTQVRKDGTPMLVAVTASRICNRAGEIRGISAILRDITEARAGQEHLQKLQAELIHLSRWNTMGMMASTLAHELNQPLTAAMNYVRAGRRLLDGPAANAPKVQEFLDKAVEETKLAGGIIRSLRDFIDKRETQRQRQNLNRIVEEVITLSSASAAEQGVAIDVKLEPQLPAVVVDKVQIQQVLLNLIRNGLDALAGEENRRLVVRTERAAADGIQISVLDSGPGIAPEIAGQLFQPFVTTKEKGMGIGLTICQSIVEGHGGRIWAESNEPAGAAFRFRLPVEEGDGT